MYREQAALRWMYLLVVLPLLTDVLESGRLPEGPRQWITEVVIGAVIVLLVRKIRKEHQAVLALARVDALTGLGNRRAFDEAIDDECARAHRSRRPLSLVYIDLDNFKQVNDRDGHEAGDRVLQQLAAAIRHVVRARIDRAFRLGGDEFALMLPGNPTGQAEVVLTRLREHCARLDPLWAAGHLGISAGIVQLESGEPAGEFVRRADEAMYQNKPSCRPRVGDPS